jgi:hypothetical protein
VGGCGKHVSSDVWKIGRRGDTDTAEGKIEYRLRRILSGVSL